MRDWQIDAWRTADRLGMAMTTIFERTAQINNLLNVENIITKWVLHAHIHAYIMLIYRYVEYINTQIYYTDTMYYK